MLLELAYEVKGTVNLLSNADYFLEDHGSNDGISTAFADDANEPREEHGKGADETRANGVPLEAGECNSNDVHAQVIDLALFFHGVVHCI